MNNRALVMIMSAIEPEAVAINSMYLGYYYLLSSTNAVTASAVTVCLGTTWTYVPRPSRRVG